MFYFNPSDDILRALALFILFAENSEFKATIIDHES